MRNFIRSFTVVSLATFAMFILVACNKNTEDVNTILESVETTEETTVEVSTEEATTVEATTVEVTTVAETVKETEVVKATETSVETTTEKAHETQPAHTHNYSAATCTSPKTCSCGQTSGSSLGHNYSNGKCTRCGATDPNYQPPHSHIYTATNCNDLMACECGETLNSVLGHIFIDSEPACIRCGELPPHTHNYTTESWTETVVKDMAVECFTCHECGFTSASFTETGDHVDSLHHFGYSNGTQVMPVETTVTHHRQVCSCGDVVNVD